MPVITIGQNITRQPDTVRYSPDKGDSTVENWSGTPVEIQNMYDLFKASNDTSIEGMEIQQGALWKLSIQRSAPVASIQQSDSSARNNAVWEIFPEEIQQDLKGSSYFNDSVNKNKFMPEIDKAIIDGTAADTDWLTKYDVQAETYFKHRINGTSSFPLFRWICRKTITVSKSSMITVSDGGGLARKPLVVATSAIGLPSDTKLVVPDDYKWLVIPPSYSKHGKVRTIVYEWRGAERFSPSLYTGGNLELWA